MSTPFERVQNRQLFGTTFGYAPLSNREDLILHIANAACILTLNESVLLRMDPFSISVGALAIIDTCLKRGNVLIKIYDDRSKAETTISETLLKLKNVWSRTETQMKFLQRIWNTLDSNFQFSQLLLLSVLESKVQKAVRLLNTVIGVKLEPGDLSHILVKKGSLRKSKYALSVKDTLDKTLSEVMEWQSQFDPSWYLLARMPVGDIDQNLESHPKNKAVELLAGLRKSVRDLSSQNSTPPRPISTNDFLGPRLSILGSSSTTAQFEGKVQYAIVNTMTVNPSMDPTGTTRSVIALTKALSRMEPFTFGLLRCCGVINKIDRYEFVFEIPRGLQTPRSLRDLLTNSRPSLNVKLDIAKQLANSVLYLHATGFVHKNIRPETILVFDHGESKSSFLAGFENFRGIKDNTFKIGDGLPERELYRHPSRQGNDPEREYMMQHDIYSLGVCLLEIGMWKPFVDEGGNKTIFDSAPDLPAWDVRKRAFETKKQLLVMADEKLPVHTGRRYKDIVEKCLTCLDDETTWDQVDDKGTLEIDVGVKFIENVLLQLHEIVI